MARKDPRRLRGWRFFLLNVVLGAGNVVVLSNVPGYTILAPYAAANLGGVTPSFGTWATTNHLIGLALGFPIARWCAARWGDYRVLAIAYVAYALASLLCASAETIWFFVPARIILGLAGGVILPLGQTVTLGEYPERRRTFGVGFWGVLSMMPFTVGVFMGGWWAETFGWRSMFLSNVPIALFAAGVVTALLYGRGYDRRYLRFDFVGYALLVVVLLGAQMILNQGNDFDWFAAPALVTALAAVLVALPGLVIWELGERNPALDVALFAERNYAVAMVCSFVGFLVLQGLLSVTVVQLQVLLGYSSTLAGMVYLAMFVLAVPFVAFVHILSKGVDARLIASLNFLGFAVTLTWLGFYDKPASFDEIALPMIFFGFFLATFFTPLATLAMHGLKGVRLLRAAEEFVLLRTAAGGFGIATMGVVLFRRTPVHQLTLADHYGGRVSISLDRFAEFSEKLQANGFTEAMANSQMARILRQQATVLAWNDAFFVGALVFALLAAFVWLARPSHRHSLKAALEGLQEARAEELMEQP